MRTRPPSRPPDTSTLDVPQRHADLPDLPAPTVEPSKRSIDRSVLGQIERLAIRDLTVRMPSTVIYPDRPLVMLGVIDFREHLLRGKLPTHVVDEAWRYLAELARVEGGQWNLFALGVAKPLLRDRAKTLRSDMIGMEGEHTHFAIAREFLFALHRSDLSGEFVVHRLVDSAYTYASGRKRRPRSFIEIGKVNDHQAPAAPDNTEAQADVNEANKLTPRQVLNEVIARANNTPGRQRITEVQADLVIRTYLEGERLRDVGAEHGLSEPSASKQRRRAANTIARLLGRADLADPPQPRAATPADPHSQATPAGHAQPPGQAG